MRLTEVPFKASDIPAGEVPARAGFLNDDSPGHSLATRPFEWVHDPSTFLQVSYEIPLPPEPPGVWLLGLQFFLTVWFSR